MEAAFQTRLASAIEFAQRLIQVPTLDAEGTRRAARVVQAELDGLSLPHERIDVQGADGERFPTVLTWIGPQSSSPAVLFNAHLDTSPPTVEWTRDAYAGTIDEGRLWGRGATVAKSDVAAYIHGLAAARDAAGRRAQRSLRSPRTRVSVASPGRAPARADRHSPGAGGHCRGSPGGGVCHQRRRADARLRHPGGATHQSLITPAEDAMWLAVALAAGISDSRTSRLSGWVAGPGHRAPHHQRVRGLPPASGSGWRRARSSSTSIAGCAG